MTLSAPWQEPPISRPMRRPKEGEKSGARPPMVGPVRIAQTHPLLAEIVDGIADWDFPDGDVARVLTSKALPSTTPYLIAQYRVPIRTERCFGSIAYPHRRYWHVATTIGTGLVKLLPNGPMGALIIRLKPEAAALLIGERTQDLVDAKIDLGNLFNANELSLLEEMLMEASDSTTRFARIESFLLRNLRQCRPDPAVCRAAQCLRRNPSIRVRLLAAQLDISERHLSRSFRAMFGASPKHFARIARIQKMLAMRQGGSTWADIAYACGFADQAHMINDFGAIVGDAPQKIFGTAVGDHREKTMPVGPDFIEG